MLYKPLDVTFPWLPW